MTWDKWTGATSGVMASEIWKTYWDESTVATDTNTEYDATGKSYHWPGTDPSRLDLVVRFQIIVDQAYTFADYQAEAATLYAVDTDEAILAVLSSMIADNKPPADIFPGHAEFEDDKFYFYTATRTYVSGGGTQLATMIEEAAGIAPYDDTDPGAPIVRWYTTFTVAAQNTVFFQNVTPSGDWQDFYPKHAIFTGLKTVWHDAGNVETKSYPALMCAYEPLPTPHVNYGDPTTATIANSAAYITFTADTQERFDVRPTRYG
jgi:hypothetical protein